MRGGGEFSVLDVYGDTLRFLLSETPLSNRPESAESADFTEAGSSQVSSPTAPSLDLSCCRGGGTGSRSDGGWSLGLPGDVEEEEDEDEDEMGLNQPKVVGGLLGWLKN